MARYHELDATRPLTPALRVVAILSAHLSRPTRPHHLPQLRQAESVMLCDVEKSEELEFVVKRIRSVTAYLVLYICERFSSTQP
jgi:hypothetical protein